MKPDVLALGAFPPAMMATLAELFTLHHFIPDHSLPPDALTPDVRGRIRAIATEAQRGVAADLIAALPRLEIVCCFGVGTDKVDVEMARARGIAVTNTPGVIADDVADLAMGLMIASARQILPADRFVRAGNWLTDSYAFTNTLGGRRLGVLGLGAIGSGIAARAAPFKMSVAYCGRAAKPDVPYRFIADPIDLARGSDFLMVACSGGAATRHLVSAQVIDALGPNGTLINVARGSVVDECALVAALQAGRLGAAALDVFEDEPRVPPELFAMANVIIQPHMGTRTIETREAMGRMVTDNIVAQLAGKPLRHQVRESPSRRNDHA